MRRLAALLLFWLTLASAQAREQFTVCFDDWAPYAAYTPERGHHGITVTLMREIFSDMGLGLKLQSATQSRCVAAAHAGRIDIMLFGDKEALPAHWLATTIPTEFWLVGAWVPQQSPLQRYEQLSQFNGLRVAMVTDYIYPAPIHGYHGWRSVMVGDAIDGVRQLAARRVDVMFDDLIWMREIATSKKLKIRMLPPLIAAQPQQHFYKPHLAPLFERYEQEVQARIKRGELDARYRAALGISYDALRRGDYAGALQ